MYLALTGLLRVVTFATTGQAVAEPVILAPLRGIQWLGGREARQQRLAQLGPLRPDRVLEAGGGDLVVLSCREKQDWDELATIKIAGRFYRLIDVADRHDERWTAVAYRLREIESTYVIRKLVKTDLRPPTGHSGAAKTAPVGLLWYFAFGPTMLPATRARRGTGWSSRLCRQTRQPCAAFREAGRGWQRRSRGRGNQ